MDHDHRFVMLDPVTDQILAECAGPDATARCPLAETPPYTCAGLRLVALEEDSASPSFVVNTMEPGRCPIAIISMRADAARCHDEPTGVESVISPATRW